jgi:uncharacterized protein YndB with AHSA1/START domain
MSDDTITRSVTVALPPAAAWARFVDGFAGWWPREHCFCGEAALESVFLTPAAGAIWGERTRDGTVMAWGGVLAAEAPRRLSLGWQMDARPSPWVPEPDPARASVIDVAFAPVPDGTRITLTHHGFSRQGPEAAAAMTAVMIGLDRWREWLDLFAASLQRDGQ